MDSVTAQIILDGFSAIEKCLLSLKDEVRGIKGYHHTNQAFEELRAYMHDGPELEDE